MKRLLLALALAIPPTVNAEPWDGANHPGNFRRLMGTDLIMTFSDLPLSGKMADDRMGWAESFWPSNKGGIAYRWNHPDPKPFKYRLHTLAELKAMPESKIAELSPAELYDIASGDYNYTLTRKTLSLYSPRDLWWEGICHGWAQAATQYAEPEATVVVNKDGIRVPFGSSDVKALLSMHEAYNYKGEPFGFVGRRCSVNGKVQGQELNGDTHPFPPSPELAESIECRDANAGATHVVMANMLGLLGKGFVADVDRFNDVWNQPIVRYDSQIVREEPVNDSHRAQGIARRVRIKTDYVYSEELLYPSARARELGYTNFVSKEPVTLTPSQEYVVKKYEYILEIDSRDRIIGGEWVSETRPDFIWNYKKSKNFKNSPIPLANLRYIYKPLRRY